MRHSDSIDREHPTVVSLAGLPGSGKSSLACDYAGRYKDTLHGARKEQRLPPPKKLIESFISDQRNAIIKEVERIQSLVTKATSLSYSTIIQDRGTYDIECFTRFYLENVLLAQNRVPDFTTYTDPISELVVYIDVRQDIRMARIAKRGKIDYGRGLDDSTCYLAFYENWFKNHSDAHLLIVEEESVTCTIDRLHKLISGAIPC